MSKFLTFGVFFRHERPQICSRISSKLFRRVLSKPCLQWGIYELNPTYRRHTRSKHPLI